MDFHGTSSSFHDDQTVEELEGRLRQSGINVGKECDRGALKLWTRREWRQPGDLSSEKKSLQVLELINRRLGRVSKGLDLPSR